MEGSKKERESDGRKEVSAEERGGDASGHNVSLVTSATEKVLMWWMIVRTTC